MKKFDNFSSNLKVLSAAFKEDISNEFIVSGIINKFSLQFELSWKLFKEVLSYEGVYSYAAGSPREIIKAAYKCCDFIDEKIWLDMLKERNTVTHLYDGGQARGAVRRIIEIYIPEFQKTERALIERYGEDVHRF